MTFVDEMKRIREQADAYGRRPGPGRKELDDEADVMAMMLGPLVPGVKGSSSSGYYNEPGKPHYGRPGHVGGSRPRSAAGGGAETEVDHVKLVLNEKDPEEMGAIYGMLLRFPDKHLIGLQGVFSEVPNKFYTMDGNGDLVFTPPVGRPVPGINGVYREGFIVLSTKTVSDPALLARVLSHEIGHHITISNYGMDRATAFGKAIIQSVYQSGFENPPPGLWQRLGLRAASLTDPLEMLADAYTVWCFGTDEQWDNLQEVSRKAKSSLENMFGPRSSRPKGLLMVEAEALKAMGQYLQIKTIQLPNGDLATVFEPVDVTPEQVAATPWYYIKASTAQKGGEGSGHFQHPGRPGEVGGSKPTGRQPDEPAKPKQTAAPEPAAKPAAAAAAGEGEQFIVPPPDDKLAAMLAAQRVADALKIEPDLTELVTRLTEEQGGYMSGLEHRVKTQGSLIDKIFKDMRQMPGERMEDVAERINDVNRYTSIFDRKTYGQAIMRTIEAMTRAGWHVYDAKQKNFWHPGGDYCGYHIIWENDQGVRFEWQYHTPESIKVKPVSHEIYKKVDKMPPGPERDQLKAAMEKMWAELEPPDLYDRLPGQAL